MTDEHTPPPTCAPPPPSERVQSRRGSATPRPVAGSVQEPIDAIRLTVDDLWNKDRLVVDSMREARCALDRLGPV